MLVMKFGGTSVGSAEAIRRVGQIVQSTPDPERVVVVSALSKVTDRLLAAAKGCQTRKASPESRIRDLRKRHREVLDGLDLPADLVDDALERLLEVLRGIYFLRELTPRSLDYVATFGEVMSSRIVAAHLQSLGLPAEAWTGWDAGILTDSHYGEAEVQKETWARVRRRLGPAVPDTIPVVTGFIARNRAGERTTLGRGGSDYTAALLGRALGADEIQIWTDVPGLMSADPRVVKDAFTLRRVSFAEAAELAFFGAKVLHPKTIKPAVEADIPVRILDTFQPEDPGTLILRESNEPDERVVEGLAMKKGQILVTITSPKMLGAEGWLAKVFTVLAQAGVSVDVVSTSEVSISVLVDPRWKADLDKALRVLKRSAELRVWGGRALVAVVGDGMQVKPGVAGAVFGVLGRESINIEMISQGGSELNVTLVVSDEDAERALRALHAEFLAGRQRKSQPMKRAVG